MPLIQFPYNESPGIAKDIEPYRLPNGVWSDGQNMLAKDKRFGKAFGYGTFISSPTIVPKSLFFCPINTGAFWAYPGLTKAYAFDVDGTVADITNAGGDYTGGASDLWNFAFLHGLGIFNNGVDDPQLWNPPALGTALVDLTNWPAATSAKVIRSFLSFLIALDVTNATGRARQMVKWSHPATQGAVPTSWDPTDATKDAGEILLSRTPGACLDCLPLGNTNVIYKEDSVHGMSFIGGQLIFGFQELFTDFGLLATECVAAFGRQHFVATSDDILIHNGNQAQSVVDAKNRKWIFNNLDTTYFYTSYVMPYYSRGEMWFCFPLGGATWPNMAFIYNYASGSSSFRELPEAARAVYSPAIKTSIGDTWASGGTGADLWNTESTITWNDSQFIILEDKVFFINSEEDTIQKFDETSFEDVGKVRRSFLERQSMAFAGVDAKGNAVIDLDSVKFIQEIYPRITGTAGIEILVYVGTQMFADETIVWQDPKTYIIGTTELLPVYLSCRYLSIRFESSENIEWEVHGFAYEPVILGRF